MVMHHNASGNKPMGKGKSMSPLDVKAGFEKAFGFPIEEATPEQVKFIADCGRHIRGRCQINSELSRWLNSVFPSTFAFFKDVVDRTTGSPFKTLVVNKKLPKTVILPPKPKPTQPPTV